MTIDKTMEERALDQANAELAAVRARVSQAERELVEAQTAFDDADRSDAEHFVWATENLNTKRSVAESLTGAAQRAFHAVEKAEHVVHESFRGEHGRAILAERFRIERAASK